MPRAWLCRKSRLEDACPLRSDYYPGNMFVAGQMSVILNQIKIINIIRLQTDLSQYNINQSI